MKLKGISSIIFNNEFFYSFDGALTSASPELPKSRKSTSGCFTIYNHNVRYAYRGNNTILFKIDKGKN